jgi:hypothetical protein
LVGGWIIYWAFAAYSDFAMAENRIAELHAAIERYQQQLPSNPDEKTPKNSIIHHLQGAGPEQLLARYEIQLAEVKQAKTANNIFILLVATVPPVLIYLIILWIVAGFWQQSKGNS